jgi:GT2 family glycosyltransferase
MPDLAYAGDGGGGASSEPSSPLLSIIVVSYNTRDMTMACLASVMAETWDAPFELIVVDNDSSDGSAEAIATLGDSVRFMKLNENIGFARANNLAARKARGQFLLLLNPDTLVLDRAIDRLTRVAIANPAAGIWGGRTLFGDRTLDPTSVWARMTPWSMATRAFGLDHVFSASPFFNPEGYGGWQRDSMRQVDIVTGCFLMIRRDLWEELDGFDRAFFMYGEEADLCMRAAALGARPLFTPTATIIHYGGASERTQAGKVEKLFRAKVTLMQRHWSAPARTFGKAMLLAWPWLRLFAATALGRTAQSALWREVWQRRAVWQAGYDTPAARPVASLDAGQPAQ